MGTLFPKLDNIGNQHYFEGQRLDMYTFFLKDDLKFHIKLINANSLVLKNTHWTTPVSNYVLSFQSFNIKPADNTEQT